MNDQQFLFIRELPKVIFKPKVIRANSEVYGLVKFFEERPPKFGYLGPEKDNQLQHGHPISIGDINSAFSKTTPRSAADQESMNFSTKVIETIEQSEPEVTKLELKYTKRMTPPTQLHFNNPTESFATRCDVIYKTLLRDCRKYFTECFQMKSMRKAKKLSKLGSVLNSFVNDTFAQYSKAVRREILFYLGCLVYPKEMITSRVGLYDQDGKTLKGKERALKVKKIKELHNFLYNFSMEKCEKFFENPYLCIIFQAYTNRDMERIDKNETMCKNKAVYRGAIDLINVKMSSTLDKINLY